MTTVRRGALGILGLVAVFLAAPPSFAQNAGAPAGPDRTRQLLVNNAHALESRGRPDMAIQIWQQVLLSAPNNTEALAGLARDYKLSGTAKQANDALEKLRAVDPNNPDIGSIQALTTTPAQSGRLRQAGDLAGQGRNDEAMSIYRDLFGDRPPDGDIAIAYYQTLYGTSNGKAEATAAMRALVARRPGDAHYAIALGTMLTYDASSRSEGIRILEAHSSDPGAHAPLRQALIWNAANPASAADLRQYLKSHPEDAEIAGHLKTEEAALASMNSGIARTPAERAAFAALNAHRLEDAQARFSALLQRDPNNGRVAAGMGFLRMQQKNFSGAISYLNQAEQNGFKAAVVEQALSTSRFWYTMSEAAQALNDGQLELSAAKYHEALAMRPRSLDALSGSAGLLTKEQQYTQAAAVYDQLLKLQPKSADAWRGLFLSYARDGQNEKALEIATRFPPAVKAAMARDPEYLRTLATIYQAQNRSADAQRVLSQALALPFPDGGTNLKSDTRLQYAGILMAAHRFDQAAAMYTQILNDDAGNVSAWMGLVSAHHQLNRDTTAIGDVEKMPPATYEAALSDPGFLSMLGSIYQQANQFDIAQTLLERSAKLQTASGGQPGIGLQLQLAAIYVQRNDTARAYELYRQVLTAHPDRIDAWKGLIAILQATNHTNEALQEIGLIPVSVRKQLEADRDFVQAEASLYASVGDTAQATEYMSRVLQSYARSGTLEPASLAIQNAWLLYNTKDDRALYPALMRLGSRQDLTAAQREVVQSIWANWSVRRAGAAIDNHDNNRAIEILEAASLAFPDNLDVKKVLAGGYLRIGESRRALSIYKSLPMQNAGAADYAGAIGAALAANDKPQAEEWLREALERFPKDYSVLSMAARFEQARGDNQRAADYWRAAIAVMPAASQTDRLAHDLAYPDSSGRTYKATTAADLQRLLNPDNEPFPKTTKLPPLPAYGPDPYSGTPPVAVGNTPGVAQQSQMISAPTTTEIPLHPPPPVVAQTLGSPLEDESASRAGTRAGSNPATPKKHHKGSPSIDVSGAPANNTGTVTLPPSEENITTTEPDAASTQAAPVFIPAPQTLDAVPQSQLTPFHGPVQPTTPQSSTPQAPMPVYIPAPQSSVVLPHNGAQADLRISAQPMDSKAAQIAAQFDDQTDGQLTQGSAAQVHALANAPLTLPGSPSPSQAAQQPALSKSPDYNPAQYTPSAQDAATGAYSAQNKQQPDDSHHTRQPSTNQQPSGVSKTKKKKAGKKAQLETVPTLVTAPGEQPQQSSGESQQAVPPSAQPSAPQSLPSPGATDEELQQRNLPPLRGPWIRIQHQPQPVSPRDEAEQQLRGLESSYSGWGAGAGLINYRSGNLGYDRLSILEAPFELSLPLGYHARVTLVAKPVFLDAGQADGTSVVQVQESTTSGTTLVTIPQPLGTDINTGPTATTTATGTTTAVTPPPQQNASGVSGEVQLAFPHLAVAAGYTPLGFLVSNWNARVQWRPANGPFTFSFARDAVKDTQLSYSGLRDPGTASLSYPGSIWGGVMANQGNVQYARGDALSGFYVGVGGQYLSGYQVEDNSRIDGTGGAYWRIWSAPEYGNLTIGANFFGMHYAHNDQAYTYGMGGYFSPQAYFLANVPFTWVGHYLTRWHYEVVGGLGVQAFQQDLTPLFPLAAQKASEIALNNAQLPALTSVGANYNLRGNMAYQIGPHWFAGAFLSANNSRNYNTVSAGFSVHYMFRTQPSTVTAPTGLFPNDGLRPYNVP